MRFLSNIKAETLFKISTLNAVSVLLKIAIGFITSKVIAIFVGPAGMALVGNFRNFLTALESIGTLGFQNGIVKYVAEEKEDTNRLKQTLTTVFIVVFLAVLLLSFLLVLFSKSFNEFVFETKYNLSFLFIVTAIALPFYVGNIVLIAIINGLSYFKKVININMIGNILGLIATISLIWSYQSTGALLSIVLTPSLLFVVSFIAIHQHLNLKEYFQRQFFSNEILKKLSSYSLMTLVSAVLGSLVYMVIRNNIISEIGIEPAGHWEGLSRLSSYYFLFISSLLSIYFLPKLTTARDEVETRSVFHSYFKIIMPAFVVGLLLLYLLRFWVIKVLFAPSFLPMADLFLWQLIGDTFKAAALVLGMQFFAQKLTKAFIVSEIFSLFILYNSSVFLMSKYHIEGVVMAHAVTYIVYFVVLSVYFRKSLFS